MNANLYLVLDQGGHSSRALIFNAQGDQLAQAAVAVETMQPRPDWVEQDPGALVESLRQAAGAAIQQLDRAQRDCLTAAALVTQRSSLVCWDRVSGQALYPVISWQDRRAANWIKGQGIDSDWVRKRTGLTLNPHSGASKIRWCLDNLEPVQRAYREKRLVCGPLASYLIARLTDADRPLVDPANASRTLLWNIDTLDWDRSLLDCFGIDRSVLPTLVATQYDYGNPEVDGLNVPLRLVNGDQSAALFVNGKMAGDTAYANIGTGAFVSVVWPNSRTCPKSLLKSLAYQGDETLFVVEGTVNAAASALDWAQESLGVNSIDQLDRWISLEREQQWEIPLFINGVAGLGSPYWCEVKTGFVGAGDARQKIIAVLESILFLLQINLLKMSEQGFDMRQIVVTGGLSRFDALCRKLADLSGVEVLRPAQVEASARGAAYWLAGCPANWQPLTSDCFAPSVNGTDTIKSRFQLWQKELNALISEG